MTKVELVKAIAAKTGFSQKDVKEVVTAIQDITFETIKTEEVKLMDGVTFSTKVVAERTARNPQDGSAIVVPEHVAPKVKLGKAIKDAVK